MQLEDEGKYKTDLSLKSVDAKKTYFSLIDIGVTVVCLLGDKLFNSTILIFLLSFYLLFRILNSSIENAFALLMLLIPNLGIMMISVSGLSVPILNILICVALLKLSIAFFHRPLKKNSLLLIGIFVVYEWAHIVEYDLHSILLLFSWSSAILYTSLFLMFSQKTYNHLIAVKYFVAGVCISTLYGIIDFLEKYGSLFNNNATIRFYGGAGDANYYSMYIMIAMFCMLYVVNRATNKVTTLVYPVLFVLLLAFGILSLSRMFLLVISLLGIILLLKVLLSLKRSKRLATFITSVVTCIAIVAMYFSEEINSNIALLFSRFTNFIGDPAALTSNRNILMEQYIDLITSNPFHMVFGMGIQDYHMRSGIYLETHNILLELFVVWGVIGFFVFIAFLLLLLRNNRSLKKISETNFIGWLPLLCIGVSFMSINAMSNESFFLLLLFAIKHIYEFDKETG